MGKTYVAVDIGASSGRLMTSRLIAGRLSLDEVHRFKNGFYEEDGNKYWDVDQLIQEILVGLEKLKQSGVRECQVGIDTWGVDYCLVDGKGQRLAQPRCYRDSRTDEAVAAFAEVMPIERLYQKTGIQLQSFNTLFQLFVEDKGLLKEAKYLLLMPDYLGFVFTGKAVFEATNASTTQLMNAKTQQLDEELLALVGLSASQFPPVVDAGTVLGRLRREDFSTFDLPEATFITVASHDTASAVVGTPGNADNWAFISSGTWSLLGVERSQGIINQGAQAANYANEWGAFKTIRFLKNIMGLWLIQEVARLEDYRYSFAELAEMAAMTEFEVPLMDVNAPCFLNPTNMIQAIQGYCREQLSVPETTAQLALTIYHNLAACYGREVDQLGALLGSPIDRLQIVGGGANAGFLNQLTADVTGIEVEAGPTEATAIGNIVMQLLTTGEVSTLKAARELIRQSFELTVYYPNKREE